MLQKRRPAVRAGQQRDQGAAKERGAQQWTTQRVTGDGLPDGPQCRLVEIDCRKEVHDGDHDEICDFFDHRMSDGSFDGLENVAENAARSGSIADTLSVSDQRH